MKAKSNLTARPGRKSADEFINAAPDAGGGAPAVTPGVAAARPAASGARKKPISLTIDAKILAELDRTAGALGLSRAGAFSLAVSRFIAQEDREAKK